MIMLKWTQTSIAESVNGAYTVTLVTWLWSVLNCVKFFEKNRSMAALRVWWWFEFLVVKSAFTKSGTMATANGVCFAATSARLSPSKSVKSSMARLLTQYECTDVKALSLNSFAKSSCCCFCFSGNGVTVPVSNTLKSGYFTAKFKSSFVSMVQTFNV